MASVRDITEVLLSRLSRSIPPQKAKSFLREYLHIPDRDIQIMEENEPRDFETRVFRLMLEHAQDRSNWNREDLYNALESAYLGWLFSTRWYSEFFPDYSPVSEREGAPPPAAVATPAPPPINPDLPLGFDGEYIITSASNANAVLDHNGHHGTDLRQHYDGKLAYKRRLLAYRIEGKLKVRKFKPEWKWHCRVTDLSSRMAATSERWYGGREGCLESALSRLIPQLDQIDESTMAV